MPADRACGRSGKEGCAGSGRRAGKAEAGGETERREAAQAWRQAASLLPKKRFMERDSQPPELRSPARDCICARTAPT